MMTIDYILGIDKHQIMDLQKIYDYVLNSKYLQNKLTSGAKSFDITIGGGFFQDKKYLIFGANKTGKTQLCHQLCVQAYIQFSKYAKKADINKNPFIFYFDTENTFRPERIKELITMHNVQLKNVLKNILVSKIMSNSAFLFSLIELENLLRNNVLNILIIDSINNHYNSDIANANITNRKAKNNFLKILIKINELLAEYNLIIVATAQVSTNLNKKSQIKVIPIGNQILNLFFSEYIYLAFKDYDKRYVQLVNSLNLPEKKLLYKITSSGIQDHKI